MFLLVRYRLRSLQVTGSPVYGTLGARRTGVSSSRLPPVAGMCRPAHAPDGPLSVICAPSGALILSVGILSPLCYSSGMNSWDLNVTETEPNAILGPTVHHRALRLIDWPACLSRQINSPEFEAGRYCGTREGITCRECLV